MDGNLMNVSNCGNPARISSSMNFLECFPSNITLFSSMLTDQKALDRLSFKTLSKSVLNLGIKRRSNSFPRRTNGSFSINCVKQNYVNTQNNSSSFTSTLKFTKKCHKSLAKPPSILIYTGSRVELFSKIVFRLKEILPRDFYTVNNLTIDALKFHPWTHENCVCLILLSTDQLDDVGWARLQEHYINSGRILFVCQNALLTDMTHCDLIKKRISLLKNVFDRRFCLTTELEKDFECFLKKTLKTLAISNQVNEVFHSKDLIGGYQFSVVIFKKTDQPLFLYMQNSENQKIQSCALFSDASADELLNNSELIGDALSRLGVDISLKSDSSDNLHLSFGYLVCQKDRLVLNIKGLSYCRPIGTDTQFVFQHFSRRNTDDFALPKPTLTVLPIFVCKRKEVAPELLANFNIFAYFDALKTKSLGKLVLHFPVCHTTTVISKRLTTAFPDADGILVVAGNQLHGQGRSGNVWLSPKGSAMFTFNFNVPVNSKLGQSIVFIQHILVVSIIDAILTEAGDRSFPVKIKWPNDIYYKREFKLGGIIVKASHKLTMFECFVSAGVNVANCRPTVCINNFLPAHKALTIENILAEIMNKFEHYVSMFVNEGKDAFLKEYCRYWLHNDEEVSIMHADNHKKEKVVICGLDENGYLQVKSQLCKRIFSVQDNGNTFDMMQGLIYSKT